MAHSGLSSRAPPRLVCPATSSGPTPGRSHPPRLGWGGGLRSPEQSGVLRTRPHGAGGPQTFPFSVGRAAPAPPLLPTPVPPISSPPFPSTIPCYHCSVTHRTWLGPALAVSSEKTGKKPSGLVGVLHPGPSWFPSSPSSVASAPDLSDSFLRACTSRPGHPSGHSPVDMSAPPSPTCPDQSWGEEGAGGAGSRALGVNPAPPPLAVCGLGRAPVVVSVSDLLNGPKEGSLVLKRFFSVLSGDQPPPRGSRGWVGLPG